MNINEFEQFENEQRVLVVVEGVINKHAVAWAIKDAEIRARIYELREEARAIHRYPFASFRDAALGFNRLGVAFAIASDSAREFRKAAAGPLFSQFLLDSGIQPPSWWRHAISRVRYEIESRHDIKLTKK